MRNAAIGSDKNPINHFGIKWTDNHQLIIHSLPLPWNIDGNPHHITAKHVSITDHYYFVGRMRDWQRNGFKVQSWESTTITLHYHVHYTVSEFDFYPSKTFSNRNVYSVVSKFYYSLNLKPRSVFTSIISMRKHLPYQHFVFPSSIFWPLILHLV